MKKRLLQASVPLAGTPLEASMTLYDHTARRSVTLMPVLKVSQVFLLLSGTHLQTCTRICMRELVGK